MDEVEVKLLGLALEPTEVNDSGGGWHLIYRLKEPILAEDEEDFAFACALWKSIAASSGLRRTSGFARRWSSRATGSQSDEPSS
jgi:hypothetical protein